MKNPNFIPGHVTAIVYVLGMSVLLPWHFFITANSYWQYKLRNTTLGENWNMPGAPLTRMQVMFMPSLILINNLVFFFFGFFTSAIAKRVSEKKRTLGSLFIILTAFLMVAIMSFIDSDEWQEGFFGISLFLVAFIMVGSATLQASLYGMIGFFPKGCIVALMSGHSLAGVVASFSEIISLATGHEDPIISGIIYFILANIFTIFSICCYLKFVKTNVYTNFKNVEEKEEKKASFKEYIAIAKKVFWIGFTFGNAMLISALAFPTLQVYITSTHSPSVWADVYFQPTITFLLFNVTEMIGRETCRWIQWPSHKGYLVHLLGASRIVIIPLILLCNGEDKSFFTLFHHDFYYIIFNAFYGFTSGYFQALPMVYYPRFVQNDETELAGTVMSTWIGVGKIVGGSLSYGLVALWGPNG